METLNKTKGRAINYFWYVLNVNSRVVQSNSPDLGLPDLGPPDLGAPGLGIPGLGTPGPGTLGLGNSRIGTHQPRT